MKKIMILLAVVGTTLFSSCSGPEGLPGKDGYDGYDGQKGDPGVNAKMPKAFEIKYNFSFNSDDGYIISDLFEKYLGGDLFQEESVLVYRLQGTNNSGSDVWQLLPTTVFFPNGDSITYGYNFSKQAFTIFVVGNNVAGKPTYINNQIFRIVIIPADFSLSVNKSNYLEVLKALNLDDKKIQEIQF